jgi:hypothetical protein
MQVTGGSGELLLATGEELLAGEQERTPEHAGVHGDLPIERRALALHLSCSPPSARAVGLYGSKKVQVIPA